MEEFERNLTEFERCFSTEEDCYAYLRQLRWPDGFRCPRCHSLKGLGYGAGAAKMRQLRLPSISDCRNDFHRTHIDLHTWFRAIWWVTNQKQGVSALGLQRLIGLGSYETA